ncbi:MAG: LLM class flavin-dependent oxidoreductase [Proteobacteria bacterium]|nr:LLM class flavin-dependent oxidoreductase [Pseudomonadota bacterium]
MDVGILLIFQNYLGRGSDEDVVRNEMRLAELAEPLGFDKLWSVEHHFTDYAACPDNLQFLSWLAGRTSKIKLATGAVIVPWNDPLRVAEKLALLDHLSGGRAILGLGRGLARVEYSGFGIDMGESRDRFDEASRMIIEALDKGFIEGDGPYYPQARTEIRPRPPAGFRDRFYCVGMSPDSVEQAAELGARLMIFSQQTWEMFAEGALPAYRASFRKHHGVEPPPPLTGDLMFCHEDPKRAEELAMEYMPNYFLTIIRHYEIMGEHFKTAKGYEHYASAADLFKQVGLETSANVYCNVQTWGTPEMILEKLRRRRELLGDFELNLVSSYGGMPSEDVEKSVRLFAREVLPELHRW